MFGIIPQDILAKYRSLEDHQDKDLAATIAGAFSKLSPISHQAANISDPLAGEFFQWQHPDHSGLVLEVVGALDDKVSMVLYKPHWIFNSRQAHLEARVELIRAICQARGADISRVDGMLLQDRNRGRPVWTGELLTVELLLLLGKTLHSVHKLPASVSSGKPANDSMPAVDPEIAAAVQNESAGQASDPVFVTYKDLNS